MSGVGRRLCGGGELVHGEIKTKKEYNKETESE